MVNTLSDRQTLLAQAKAKGLTDLEACREAGYRAKTAQASCNQVARMMKKGEFVTYLEELREEIRERVQGESVLELRERREILARIARAKEDEDPRSAIAAIAEDNRMTGGYEPERHEMEISVVIGGYGKAEG